MNSDESSKLDRLKSSNSQRLIDLNEQQREFMLRRAAARAVSSEANLAAVVSNLSRSLQPSLLSHNFIDTASMADSLTGGYLTGSSLSRSLLATPMESRLDELRIARFIAAELSSSAASATSFAPDGSSSLGRGSLHAPAAPLLPGSSILANVYLAQEFPVDERLQVSRGSRQESQRIARHADLLKRSKETMMLKPSKKVRRKSFGEKNETVKEVNPGGVDDATRFATQKKLARSRRGFPLPQSFDSAPDEGNRTIGVSLNSYRELWNKMGGHKFKEIFQRRVQNAKVPLERSCGKIANEGKPDADSRKSNSHGGHAS